MEKNLRTPPPLPRKGRYMKTSVHFSKTHDLTFVMDYEILEKE